MYGGWLTVLTLLVQRERFVCKKKQVMRLVIGLSEIVCMSLICGGGITKIISVGFQVLICRGSSHFFHHIYSSCRPTGHTFQYPNYITSVLIAVRDGRLWTTTRGTGGARMSLYPQSKPSNEFLTAGTALAGERKFTYMPRRAANLPRRICALAVLGAFCYARRRREGVTRTKNVHQTTPERLMKESGPWGVF